VIGITNHFHLSISFTISNTQSQCCNCAVLLFSAKIKNRYSAVENGVTGGG
jgi:hypothetical protein